MGAILLDKLSSTKTLFIINKHYGSKKPMVHLAGGARRATPASAGQKSDLDGEILRTHSSQNSAPFCSSIWL